MSVYDMSTYKDSNSDTWETVPSPTDPTKISVDPQGNAWTITSSGTIYRYIKYGWLEQAANAIDIGVGGDGSVWYLNPYGEVKTLTVGSIERIYLNNATSTST